MPQVIARARLWPVALLAGIVAVSWPAAARDGIDVFKDVRGMERRDG